LIKPPVYKLGPYNYTERIDMFCSQANGANNFTQYRFCTYNKATQAYELQGTPHECYGQ